MTEEEKGAKNLGEEFPNRQSEEKIMGGCSFCPTCGGELAEKEVIANVATDHTRLECPTCGLGWVATYQKGPEELLLHIAPES